MNRTTPGQGCPCARCKEPLIVPPFHGAERNAELLAMTAEQRAVRRRELGMPATVGRGGSA